MGRDRVECRSFDFKARAVSEESRSVVLGYIGFDKFDIDRSFDLVYCFDRFHDQSSAVLKIHFRIVSEFFVIAGIKFYSLVAGAVAQIFFASEVISPRFYVYFVVVEQKRDVDIRDTAFAARVESVPVVSFQCAEID